MATESAFGDHRQQAELSALKEQTRQMENKSQKQENELNLRNRFSTLHSLQKELHKSAQSLTRGKKAKEFEILLNENELMLRKMRDQEEEFQLQNETLMTELAQLVKTNENLDNENKYLKDSLRSQKDDVNCAALMDEIRHLQAQNTVLQNSFLVCQQELEQKRCRIQSTTTSQMDHNGVLVSEDLINQAPLSNAVDAAVVETEGNGNLPQFISEESRTGDALVNNNSFRFNGSSCLDATGDAWKLANDLRLSLETEKEENSLLKEQLQSLELKCRNECDSLQTEIRCIGEKLKKKQESLIQLQEDKERLYCELSQKIADLESEKENQIERLQRQKSHLEQELTTAKKLEEDRAGHYRKHVSKLEGELIGLQQLLDLSRKETGQQLIEQTDRYGKEIERMDQQIHELESSTDDLKTQLKESNEAQTCTMDQLLAIQIDRDRQILALQEMSRVADRRKALLDELAIKYQQDIDHQKEQMRSMSDQHSECIKELTDQNDQLNDNLAEFDELKSTSEALKTEVQRLEAAKNWLERSLKETEENLEQTKEFYETLLQTRIADHRDTLASLTKEHETLIKGKEVEIDDIRKENEENLAAVAQLKQEIKDGMEDKKLREKKGATTLKELKRQLTVERKRGDRLQEKLQELTVDTDYRRKSVEELFRYYDMHGSGDNRSISSLSPSGTSFDNIRSQSPSDESSLLNLQQENDELLKRLAEVQQSNWILEEKVSHLEASNAAMADDLIHKTALIDHFSVDSKTGKHTNQVLPPEKTTPLKRMMDFVKDRGPSDEGLVESNRRLQNAVEETLTKNMFLQQNLETVSQELYDLRRLHGLSNDATPVKRVD